MSRRNYALASLGLAAIALVVFREIVFEGRVLYERDIHLVWEPVSGAFVRAWRQGAWPLWDDAQGFGQSLLANPQAQVLYPPAWLTLVLPFGAYCTLYAVGHALGSAVGFLLLGRRLGLSLPAAFTGAALWLLSGPFLSSVSLWHHFAGAAWLPWVLLGFLTLRRRMDASGVVLASLPLAGQILAGSADLVALTLVPAAGLLILEPDDGWRTRGRVVTLAVMALLLALGLTAPQWGTSLETVFQSARSELSAQARTYWSVHPLGLLDLVLPVPLAILPLSPGARAALFDSREPFIPSLYLGLVALPLVVAGLAHPRRRLKWLYAGLGLVAVLVSLGRHAPVYGVLAALVPPVRILRFPVKAMFLVAFLWASLAGLGVDVWWTRASRERRRAVVLLLLGAALLLAAVCAPATLVGGARPWLETDPPARFGRALGWHLGLAAAACGLGGLAAWSETPRLRRGLSMLILTAALAQLVLVVGPQNPGAPSSFYAYRPAVLEPLAAGPVSRLYVFNYALFAGRSRRYLGREHSLVPRPGLDLPQGTLAGALLLRSYLFPASASSWGVRYGFDLDMTGLAPREVTMLDQFLWTSEGTPGQLRLLQLGSVSHVVTLHDARSEGLAPAGEFPELFLEPVRLWRVPETLPRFLVVGGARMAPPLEAMALIAEGSVDPRKEVLLSEAGGGRAPPADFRGSARLVEERPGFQKVEVELSHPGHLVVLDSFAPGWQAFRDGEAVPVRHAHGAFRAIEVPPGSHEIVCRYRPLPLVWGSALSLALVLAGAAVVARGR